MKFIKIEDKHWNKKGRICYVNPMQISQLHWPAEADQSPAMVYVDERWYLVLDKTSLTLLASSMADDLMDNDRREDLVRVAVQAAKTYQAKEGEKVKTADEEEEAD